MKFMTNGEVDKLKLIRKNARGKRKELVFRTES